MFYKWAISVLFWFTDQAGTLQWRVKLYLLTLHIIHIHKSLLRCMLYIAPIVHKFAQFNFANTFVFNLFSGAQTLRLVGSLQTETWDVRFATKNHAFTKLAFLSSFYISSFANFWFRHMVEISQVWWFLFLALVQQVF